MNQYQVVVTSSLAAMTAPQRKLLTRIVGYLGLMAIEFRVQCEIFGNAGLGPLSTTINASTPLRLPSNLGVTPLVIQYGPAVGDEAALILTDNQSSSELQNMERAIVNAGDFICVLLRNTDDVSDELITEVSIATVGSGKIVMGIASQSAQEGVYNTPFASALAFTNFGPIRDPQQLASISQGVAGIVSTPPPPPVPVELPFPTSRQGYTVTSSSASRQFNG